MDSDPPSVLQLRISLCGISAPVWRRLLIPEQVTIAQLHRVMPLAMGWNDEHLHQFIIGGHRDGVFQLFDGPDTLSLAAFRCKTESVCCDSVLGVTNRIVGRDAASQIASASTKSFLFDLTNRRTNCGEISLTICSNVASVRAI